MKSQSSIEFIVIVGAVLLIFITTIGFLQKSISEKKIEKRNFEFQEFAQNIQNEINIASKATDGYQRTFSIPEKIEGMGFQIRLIEESVYLNSSQAKYAISLPVTNVTGQLREGSNTIKKINRTIYLN